MYNFHVFVLVSTIIYYMLLRKYKSNITSNSTVSKTNSNFIYVLYVPVLLYTSYYFFIYQKDTSIMNTMARGNSSIISDNLMSSPYPESISSI